MTVLAGILGLVVLSLAPVVILAAARRLVRRLARYQRDHGG
jgi:hypothetical protein